MARRSRPPNRLTVQIDTEEKKPLEFLKSFLWYDVDRRPHLMQVRTKTIRLRTAGLPGDYTILGYGDVVLVERKGSYVELTQNLFTKDRPRFIKALDGMCVATKNPCLLLDMPLTTKPSRYVRQPDQIIDTIFRECHRRKLSVLWFPPSRNSYRTGELLLRWMWQCVYLNKYL